MKFSKLIGAAVMALAFNAWAAVDINTASVADLDSIKGIGPSTSSKIMDQRKSAKFKDWPDLIQRVSGIGASRAAKLSNEGLTVNGAKFNAAAEPNGTKLTAVKTKDSSKAATK